MSGVALITGSNGGIGKALCRAFADAGYRVIGMDRTGGPTGPDSGVAVTIACDIRVFASDTPERTAMFQTLREEIGSEGLGVLVNNAAVQLLHSTDELTVEDLHETLATNLIAPLMLVQGLLGELERGGGSVINIGSVHGTATKPRFVSYATSKAALAGLTRALAVDLGGRVRVNTISPGAISTPMLEAGFEGRPEARRQLDSVHPLGRVGTAAEVASTAVFLASAAASNITALDLRVDGGVAARLHDPA